MKRFNLFMAIMLALITTTLIVLFFFTVSYSKEATALVTFVSFLGYMGSALYFYNHKKEIG
jgi:hypothetical protein